MDQQAKKHLQEEFDASLEEKDQLISVLQTQVEHHHRDMSLKTNFFLIHFMDFLYSVSMFYYKCCCVLKLEGL